jgi:hypothetical protein
MVKVARNLESARNGSLIFRQIRSLENHVAKEHPSSREPNSRACPVTTHKAISLSYPLSERSETPKQRWAKEKQGSDFHWLDVLALGFVPPTLAILALRETENPCQYINSLRESGKPIESEVINILR